MIAASITDTYFAYNLQRKKKKKCVILIYDLVVLLSTKEYTCDNLSFYLKVNCNFIDKFTSRNFTPRKLKMLRGSSQWCLQCPKSNKPLSCNRCCIQTRRTIFLLLAINLSCIKWVLRVGSNAIIRRLRTFALVGSSAR